MNFGNCHAFSPHRALPSHAAFRFAPRFFVVVVLAAIVQFFAGPSASVAQDVTTGAPGPGNPSAIVRVEITKLPSPVQDMRDAILAAVGSGDISEMRTAIEWNELRPELGIGRDEDPIAAWQALSSDGQGYEILAILGDLLGDAPARVPLGRDIENNDVYVWPYLAELDGRKLTPSQMTELYRLVPHDVAARFAETGKWTWYRLAIGADGTWHIFAKTP